MFSLIVLASLLSLIYTLLVANPTQMLKTIVPEMNINNWADLPADILARILNHGHDLNTDLTRLRGVCSSWRYALPLEEHYPSFRSHIQVPSLSDGLWCDRPLFLLETFFYFFSPINPCGEGSNDSSGWVARMGQIAPNKWRLLIINPFTYDNLYNPNANGNLLIDPPIVGEINLLDCRVFMLAKVLTLVDELDFNAKPISIKVVGEWDLTSSTGPLSAILVLLAPDPVSGLLSRLLLLRLNDAQNQQNEWAEISESDLEDKKQNNYVVCDIAYCNGIFFVFQFNSDCWRLGTVNPSIKTLVLKPFASGGTQMFFSGGSLVPSKLNDCLYLVLGSFFSCDEQCHLILNEHDGASVDESKIKFTNTVGVEILFCSNYVSFSFQSSKLLNYTPSQDKSSMASSFSLFFNQVRFNTFIAEDVKGFNLEKYRRYKKNICSWRSSFIQDLNEKSVFDFVGKNKVLALDVMFEKEPDRDYKRLFFPPPAWVKWRCPSLDNLDINLQDLNDDNPSDVYQSLTYDMDRDFEEYYDFYYGSS